MTNSISVLIVDDHSVVRAGIRNYLITQADMQVVGEAASGAEAVRMAIELVPDVALMDLSMPEMDGMEATRRIREASPRTRVVVLTSFHDDAHIFPAIRAGALSYLLKDIGPEELAAAVRAAAVGEAVLHPRVAARVMQEMQGHAGKEKDSIDQLSPREREVLQLIAEGFSNALIAEKLVISEKTVKGHVSNILAKLHIADRTQAAVMAWRKGIMQTE
jgi:two-component system, NarL family, response regulator LiaR